MAGRQCYHCKQWIAEGDAHDCWTTTEAALTRDLSEDLRDAYERIRETALEFGEQRIYASHRSIMFSRLACHFFVRPQSKHLELVIFLGRTVKAPQIRSVVEASRLKRAHVVRITHRDLVEAPITDWMREAYGLQDQRPAAASRRRSVGKPAAKRTRARPRKKR